MPTGNGALKHEIFRLRREWERFGGDLSDPADRPEDIATVMIAKLSKNKAAAVASAILKVLKGKTQAQLFNSSRLQQFLSCGSSV